ncbi:MAG: very short patch repair endonuclease [Phycisphaerae bacterium]|nr:very short patch repair endonuclease [Phycisphaerae bacterium]
MSPEQRRRVMSSIRKTDTKPELVLRSALWAAGLRGWRCHVRMVGTPDVVFTRWKLAVFVDGVWWHGHPDYLPNGRRGPYWDQKIAGNVERDHEVTRQLEETGWVVLRFWDIDVLANPAKAAEDVKRKVQKLRRLDNLSPTEEPPRGTVCRV